MFEHAVIFLTAGDLIYRTVYSLAPGTVDESFRGGSGRWLWSATVNHVFICSVCTYTQLSPTGTEITADWWAQQRVEGVINVSPINGGGAESASGGFSDLYQKRVELAP